MIDLLSSRPLQLLAESLLHFLWQGALLFALLKLVSQLLRSARQRHAAADPAAIPEIKRLTLLGRMGENFVSCDVARALTKDMGRRSSEPCSLHSELPVTGAFAAVSVARLLARSGLFLPHGNLANDRFD